MQKLFASALIFLGITAAQAQFPGAPTGSANGRSQNASTSVNLESTAPKGNAKITGTLTDASAAAVEFASVALYSKATGQAVDGTMADEKGKFALKNIAAGEYKLLISFIGFKEKEIDNLKLTKSQELDLGTIQLEANVKTLDEVVITGERALIEEKVDRMVYNAEKDITARGGDAADVLKKVPMLSVDLDGNVSLRGSQSITVLINNKPSTILASSIADALKMIPADLIKSVEVITSPSAKYDAEGSAGIINIITKKSTLQGLTLNTNAGIGARGSDLSLNGTYRQGKLGVTLGGFGRAFYNNAATSLSQNTLQNGVFVQTQQNTNAFDNGLFGRYNLGFDYDLGKNQALTAGVSFGTRNFVRSQEMTTNLLRDGLLNSTSLRNVTSKDLSNNVDINLDYIRTFDKPGKEWSISTLYSRSNLTNNFNADLLTETSSLLARQKNLNHNLNQEFTLQTDYQTPIKNNQMIEFGAKTIVRQVNSNFSYFTAGATGDFTLDTRNPAGLLNYQQNIVAGYASYTFSTANKYTFKVGSRYEYTSINAADQNSIINIPNYGALVPSLNISKKVSDATTLKFAYNRRIQRPGLQQLNPNFNAANPQNITLGNPNLNPELTDNVELSLSTNIKKTYLSVSVFNRSTNNSIMRVSTLSDTLPGAIVTTFQNIGKQQVAGANVFANVYLTPKWTLNGGIDVFYNTLEGKVQGIDGSSVTATNAGWVVGGRLMSSLALDKGWTVQANGGMRGNQVTLQGVQGSFYMYSLGVKKDFNNKKGSLGLAAENFLGGMTMRSTAVSPLLNQTFVNNIYNQNIKLTFSYKIGKMSLAAPKKTKSVKNDDVKEGGESR
ncbi:MAG: TonB-dependent receptor domain-containing protein [Runella sp.]